MTLEPVPPNFLHMVWDEVRPFLDAALKTGGGEYDVDQLKVFLTLGHQHLLVAFEDGVATGAIAVAFQAYPNDYVAFVTALGGAGLVNDGVAEQFSAWAKSHGATKMRGANSKDATVRLFKQKLGMTELYTIMEKTL